MLALGVPLLLLLALVLWLLIVLATQLYRYTIVPTDTPATYLRLQLHRPTLLQRVYRELAATLLVAATCCVARTLRTRVFLLHRDTMRACWFKREGRPLLTIANHTSPAEIGAMAQLVRPLWYRQQPFTVANMRVVYSSWMTRHVSMLLRLLPVDSKQMPDGVKGFRPDEAMRRSELSKLCVISDGLFSHGQWLHISPEGRIWQSHEQEEGCYVTLGGRRSAAGENVAPFQLGAALLLCTATVTPLVHVFTYSGFDEVLRYEPPHQRQTTRQRKGLAALVNFGGELLDLAGEIAAFKENHGAFDPLALTPAQTAFLHALSDKMRNKMVALKREGDAELRRLVEADGQGGDPL